MPTNLLLISSRADLGGGPRHMDLLIQNLPEQFKIFVACPYGEPFYLQWKNNLRVKEMFILPHRSFKLSVFLKLALFVRKHDITLIHSHGKGAGLYSRLLKLLFWYRPVVHTFHGIHFEHYNAFVQALYLIYERVMAYLSNALIYVSSGEQKICQRHGIDRKAKSFLVRNGIKGLIKISDARSRLSLLNDNFVVTTISRFNHQKNMALALSIAVLLRSEKAILFLWIGDGEERESLEAKINLDRLSNIKCVGNQVDIQTFLSASDVYLTTSRWEGLPLALLEACSLGLPIVSTDVVGNNEVVENAKNGFLFPPDAEDKAAECILKLYRDKKMYYRMSLASQSIFKSNFKLDYMIERTAEIYNSLLDKGYTGNAEKYA